MGDHVVDAATQVILIAADSRRVGMSASNLVRHDSLRQLDLKQLTHLSRSCGLQAIFKARGENHLIQLLRTFSKTENNGARIDAFALYAISDLMVAYPKWADSGLRWLEVFDRVDLAEIQRQAKLNRDTVPQRQGIATMLFQELSEAFADDTPEAEEDSNMPTENDLIYGTNCRPQSYSSGDRSSGRQSPFPVLANVASPSCRTGYACQPAAGVAGSLLGLHLGAGHSGTTAGASVFTLSQLELVFLANSAAVLAEGASHRRARRSGSDSWD
jgi:hypothetical protein